MSRGVFFSKGGFWCVGAVVCLMELAFSASGVSPKLNTLSPVGGQRGQEVEIQFSGERLEDACEVIFYSSGFSVLSLNGAKPGAVVARVRIAPDCALGEHLVRMRTASGVSEIRTFYVSDLKNIAEIEPNNERAQAQSINLNTTVNGAMGQDDVDFYKVVLKKGERLSVEVEAMRLGRTALDSYLAIYDSGGNRLGASDDLPLLRQDSALSIIAPRDDGYFIEVRESSYSGQANSPYRLHVGTFPRPIAVFPLGGSPGEKLKLHFAGAALDDFEQEVALPGKPVDSFAVFAEQNHQSAPSPNWLRVVAMPNVLATGRKNRTRETAVMAPGRPPVAFNGVIEGNDQEDWFKFTAEKGKALDVSVYARRLRSRLDSVIEVFDAKGKSLAQNDDAGGADSALKFTPPENGDYFLRITDQLGRGGRDYPYRIEVAPVAPALSVSIPQVARNDSQSRQFIAVPRGNRFATLVAVKRVGAPGPVALSLEGLPPGVAMRGEELGSTQDARPVVFEAAADAPLGARLLDLAVSTTNGTRGEFFQNIEFIYGQNNNVYYGTRADKFLVAVTEAAPFELEVSTPRVPLVRSGTLNLRVTAHRTNGFDEPITVRMVWNPPGVGSQPEITIPKGSNSVLYPLNANGGAELAEWTIALLGSASVRGGQLWVSSPLIPLKIESALVTGKLETLVAEPGEKGRLICKVEMRESFEGEATVRIVGLPEKVNAPAKMMRAEDKEVAFEVQVDADCSPRTVRNLACVLELPKNGELISQTLASGGTLRIVPPKKIKTGQVAGAKVKSS